MQPAYSPDNTKTSLVLVVLMAAAAILVAVLAGLSDKPDVAAIGISAGPGTSAASVEAATPTPTADAAADAGVTTFGADVELDEAGDPILDDLDTADTAANSALSSGDAATTGDDDSAPTPAPAVTSEPTPTPEVAAILVPTPDPEADDADDPAAAALAATASPPPSGTLDGAFFTRRDEDEGATVAENSITITFADDGTGTFTGVLDLTYVNRTRVVLEMNGTITWEPGPPQIETVVTGSFVRDALIDADDVSADEARLLITNVDSGSGSLCASQCFGFSFGG